MMLPKGRSFHIAHADPDTLELVAKKSSPKLWRCCMHKTGRVHDLRSEQADDADDS